MYPFADIVNRSKETMSKLNLRDNITELLGKVLTSYTKTSKLKKRQAKETFDDSSIVHLEEVTF